MSRGSSFLFLSTGCGDSQSCFIGHSICKYGLVLELVVVVAGIVLGMIFSVLRVSVLLVCLYMHFPFCQSMVVHSFVCQFVFFLGVIHVVFCTFHVCFSNARLANFLWYIIAIAYVLTRFCLQDPLCASTVLHVCLAALLACCIKQCIHIHLYIYIYIYIYLYIFIYSYHVDSAFWTEHWITCTSRFPAVNCWLWFRFSHQLFVFGTG